MGVCPVPRSKHDPQRLWRRRQCKQCPNLGSLQKTGIRHFQSRSRLRTTSSLESCAVKPCEVAVVADFIYSALSVHSVGGIPVLAVNTTPPAHVGLLLCVTTQIKFAGHHECVGRTCGSRAVNPNFPTVHCCPREQGSPVFRPSRYAQP